LFMCSLLGIHVYRYSQPVRFISHGINSVKPLFKLCKAEMQG